MRHNPQGHTQNTSKPEQGRQEKSPALFIPLMQTSVGFSQICKNDSKVPEALQRNASGTFFDISQVVIDTLQRIRTMNNDVSSYANDYWDIGALKGLADRHRISVLLIHHLWKLNDGAPMNMVSGTTGLSGATDSSFVLRKSNGDRLICLRRADGVDDPLQRASPSTLWRPPQPLCGTFPSDRAVVFSVPSRKATIGPQTARKRGKRRGTQVFAAHCMTTGDSAENKHCLWLFTPAHSLRHLFAGRSPAPTPSCAHFCGSAKNRLRRRNFKGEPVPLGKFPSSPRETKRFETGGTPVSKKPNRTKSVPLTFYVTEADSQRIHRKAEACGVSLTKYLTDCAVGKEIIRIDALTEFTKALKAQGNNLNQLTTLANMGRITAVNVQEARALYADIQRSLKTLLERTV